jgi:hypothetical protein
MQLWVTWLVDCVSLSCAVVFILIGKEGRRGFELHKPGGESKCTPCGGNWGDGLGRAVEAAE